MRNAAVVLVGLAAGCSSPAGMQRSPPPAVGPAPLRIEASPVAAAPWLAFTPAAFDDPLELPRQLDEGDSAAIAKVGGLYFAITVDDGVIGPLPVPDAVEWVGLFGAGGGVVLAGTRGRDVFVAQSLDAAVGGAFEPLPLLAGDARAWDAGGGVFAVATERGVEVLGVLGAEWVLALEGQATQVHVRHDGVIVAQLLDGGSLVTHVSADGGQNWTNARYQPGMLSRWGAWIIEDNADCPVVLSSDGRRWVVAEELYDVLGRRPYWTDALQATTSVVPFDADQLVTERDPPPPPFRGEGEAVGTRRPCPAATDEPVDDRPGLDEPAVVFPNRPMPRVVGTAGDDARVRGSAVALRLLSDGVCDGDGCPREAPMARAPHAVQIDHRSGEVRVIDLPQGCWPLRALSAAGLELLACRDGDEARWYARDGDEWAIEMVMDWSDAMRVTINAAPDGTVGLFTPCFEDDCVVHVRRPVERGSQGAWRRVDAAGALAYRLVSGGRVLALAEADGGGVRFEQIDSSGAMTVLADRVEVPDDVVSVEVVDAQIAVRTASGRSMTLHRDGMLR